jgi:hypothetical protein
MTSTDFDPERLASSVEIVIPVWYGTDWVASFNSVTRIGCGFVLIV